MDNFGDDWTIRREVALEMGQSFLDGGPVLNPYINIKAENDTVEYEKTTLLMPDNFADLLDGAVTSCTQLEDNFDQCLRDLNETDSSLDVHVLSDKSFYDTSIDMTHNTAQKCQPEPKVKEQKRKRNHSENDHTYANNKQNQIENVMVKKPKSNSNLKDPKDDKTYWEKRQKNNLAAKRSREMKRGREIELVKKSTSLEKENADLLKQMEKLKKLVHKLELKLKK